MLLDDLVCVGVEHLYDRDRLHRRNKSFIDRKRTDSGGNVSAVCLFIDIRDHDINLSEGIVDIHILTVGWGNDRDLACGGNGSSHAVDLLDIRASHHF